MVIAPTNRVTLKTVSLSFFSFGIDWVILKIWDLFAMKFCLNNHRQDILSSASSRSKYVFTGRGIVGFSTKVCIFIYIRSSVTQSYIDCVIWRYINNVVLTLRSKKLPLKSERDFSKLSNLLYLILLCSRKQTSLTEPSCRNKRFIYRYLTYKRDITKTLRNLGSCSSLHIKTRTRPHLWPLVSTAHPHTAGLPRIMQPLSRQPSRSQSQQN